MTEMDKATFWAFGWAQAFLYPDLSGQRTRRRSAWAVHRYDLARREEDKQWSGPRCSFCEMAGHDESQVACPERIKSAAVYGFCGSRMYSRPEGGAQ